MKRLVAILLVLLTAVSPVLSGCSVLSRGSDYCYKFLEHIKNAEYDKAYDMLAESVRKPDPVLTAAEKQAAKDAEKAAKAAAKKKAKAEKAAANATPTPEGMPVVATPTPSPSPSPTPTPTPSPTPTILPAGATPNPEDSIEKTISREDFIKKYQSIFEELQLTGMDYVTTDVLDGEILSRVDYDLTYHSERAGGDLTYSFTIEADRIEHRWVINWSPKLIFPTMDWGCNIRVGVLQANRGEILADGVAYAQNVNTITVFAVPSSIVSYAYADAKAAFELAHPGVEMKTEDYPSLDTIYQAYAEQVAAIPELETTAEDIVKALNKQINDFAKLKTFFPDEIDYNLKQTILAIRGTSIDTANYGTLRYYPYSESLCHIVGYAGIITLKEKLAFEAANDTRYNGDSWLGREGLEKVYEETLLGTNGRFTYIQDATGGSKGMLYSEKAVDGKDLHLTIDPELQTRLENVIDVIVYDKTIYGAVVVLNPKTGELLASVSWPGFDSNYLARGMPEEEWEAYKLRPDIPLFNRCMMGLYTPGSVFKTMTAAALIETNTMTISDVFPSSEAQYIDGDAWMPSDTFMSTLQYRTSAETFTDQSIGRPLRRTANSNRHTPMNMTNSLIDSDNLFFAYGALRLGWSRLEQYLTKMGWTEAIGCDGLVVAKPQIYDVTMKQNDYDLAVTGYGQGQLLVSPLQLASFVSAYANDGMIMQPYVVDSIWHADGTDYTLVEQRTPKVWKYALQKTTVDAVLPALRMVCTDGTARYLGKSFINRGVTYDLGYTLAGKTGTAELGKEKKNELAWLVAWRDGVEADEARLVCVMLELALVDGKVPPETEIAQMKTDIARAVLRKDVLN